jgi:hypothetical protein
MTSPPILTYTFEALLLMHHRKHSFQKSNTVFLRRNTQTFRLSQILRLYGATKVGPGVLTNSLAVSVFRSRFQDLKDFLSLTFPLWTTFGIRVRIPFHSVKYRQKKSASLKYQLSVSFLVVRRGLISFIAIGSFNALKIDRLRIVIFINLSPGGLVYSVLD